MLFNKSVFLLGLFLISGLCFSEVVEGEISEGVMLYDSGNYSAAIEKFQSILKDHPENETVQYELALTYLAIRDLQKCIQTSENGLKQDVSIRNEFFMLLGACYSQSEMHYEAIATFELALDEYPSDPNLRINYAISLALSGSPDKAFTEFKKTIINTPNFSSAYFHVAQVYSKSNYRVPALLMYLRFMMLDSSSPRGGGVSVEIFRLLNWRTSVGDDGKPVITTDISTPKDEGDFSSIDLLLSMSASIAEKESGEKFNTNTEREVQALVTFVKLCCDADIEDLNDSFSIKYSAEHLDSLRRSDDLEAFLYLIAAKARKPGALEWLNANERKVKKLSKVLGKSKL